MIETLYSQALDTDVNGFNGETLVQKWAIAALTMPSGAISQIRFTFEAGAGEATTITNAYVGHAAGAGDAYDFSATPVQILWAGAGTKAISAGATAVSDWAVFAYNKTSPLLVAFYIGGGVSVDTIREKTGLGANIVLYEKVANDAATVDKTGYGSNSGFLGAINKIEVETPGGGFILFF